MKAMILKQLAPLSENSKPLELAEWPKPEPQENELLLKVATCGVCHTELDEIEGRTAPPELPVILGHQVVGTIVGRGPYSEKYEEGDRVGVAWIYHACGECEYCTSGQENLCPHFLATGRDRHGGYAEYMTVPEEFVYKIPDSLSDAEAAPLLCAGAIGYRSFALTEIENGANLGLTGFGASAHLVMKFIKHIQPDTKVYVFARNPDERKFARELGAVWAGDTTDTPPALLNAIIDTTPAWKPVVKALERLKPGGRLVINAIRKEAGDQDYLQNLDYSDHLWQEKEVKSVANVTRKDVSEFLDIAGNIPLKPEFQLFDLEDANDALTEMKESKIRGAKVLQINT